MLDFQQHATKRNHVLLSGTNGGKWAKWDPDFSGSESYKVSLRWTSGSNRATNAKFRVYHVNVGVPAKSVRVKSIAPPEHQHEVNLPHSE